MKNNENGIALIYYIIIVVSIILIIISLGMIFLSGKPNIFKVKETTEIDIDKINDFEFAFEKSKKIVVTTIDNSSKKYDIETVGGDVFILVNDKKYGLKLLLDNNLINIDKILAKLEKDAKSSKCFSDMYLDGGSMLYVYDGITIIATNSMSMEKQSIIFGPSDMDVFNTYELLKDNLYTGSDFEEGMGLSAEVAQIVNDKLWIVKTRILC